METKIITAAESYQELDRQIKDLQSKQKQFKDTLLKYAEENKSDFDAAFQLKFPNGTYVSQRVKDVIEGSKDAKKQLLDEIEYEFIKTELDEKLIINEAPKDTRLRKLLTKLGIKITQKETFAIYAG
ncbi:hypothetical protein ETU08_01895 [Apibacter muscae]|uniref:Uncharacterized protein n=1 Tax=Apibacter muscae TaxID=2509004 RepID=A0A563DK55_9FLAO|nr:host-nuclease inhibitor Gam family protein [Apibacter muscae]TWP30537.1 hypothetical protein ETU09_00620 [Apibacter muscae]TWP31257.1 hypothetical protein ETU08_01895 [Apibacter muscae]